MSSYVEICFNPYSSTMQILINGNSPSEYSSLIQYMNEPLYKWCEHLFDLLYNEINDKYALLFIGRKFDADILRSLALENEYCTSFTHRDFMIDTSLQKRMILLNNILKQYKSDICKFRIDTDFIIEDSNYCGYVKEIEIKNRFCFVKKYIKSISEYNHSNKSAEHLFVICTDFNVLNKISAKAKCSFALKVGEKTEIKGFKNNVCFIEFKKDEFFDIIFECFFFAPLCEAFVKCILLLDNDRNVAFSDGFRILMATTPLVKVEFPDKVELHRSTPIKIYTEPLTAEPPEITFEYDRSGIINCNNQRVEGLKEGTVNVLIYEKGSKRPFALKQIKVIKRNRITSLLLSDKEMIMGEHDRKLLTVTYFPENADNADTIEWLSTDTSIATISKDGKVHALSVGKCQLICTAENVSSRMNLEIKPYLKDLILEKFVDSQTIEITLDDDIDLSIEPVPRDAIDRDYTISSSNTMIINVVGTKLHPVSLGEADITIVNTSGSIKKYIKLAVVKKVILKDSKKRSFWNIFKK